MAYTPEEQSLMEAYYRKPTVGTVSTGLTPEQYQAAIMQSLSGKQGSIEDMIRQALTQGTQQINEASIPERTKAMEEARILGKSYAGVNRLDEQKQKNIAEMISSLMSKKAELLSNAYGQLPQQQLAGAQMFGQQGLQGQSLGLQERSGFTDWLNQSKNRAQQDTFARWNRDLAIGRLAQEGALQKEFAGAEGKSRLEAQEDQPSYWEGVGGQALSSLAGGAGGALTSWGLDKFSRKKK